MRHVLAAGLCICCAGPLWAQQPGWPAVSSEMKPGTRWWWMGSAVDSVNLAYNLREYARAGIGTVEITPIYGVQGNERNERPYLSPAWMRMYDYTLTLAKELGMQVDMNNGTGWPFGGPEVSMQDAACQLVVSEYRVRGGKHVQMSVGVDDAKQKPYAVLERLMAFADGGKCLDLTANVRQGTLTWDAPEGEWRLIAAFCGKTRQKVKRAAPGGEDVREMRR